MNECSPVGKRTIISSKLTLELDWACWRLDEDLLVWIIPCRVPFFPEGCVAKRLVIIEWWVLGLGRVWGPFKWICSGLFLRIFAFIFAWILLKLDCLGNFFGKIAHKVKLRSLTLPKKVSLYEDKMFRWLSYISNITRFDDFLSTLFVDWSYPMPKQAEAL